MILHFYQQSSQSSNHFINPEKKRVILRKSREKGKSCLFGFIPPNDGKDWSKSCNGYFTQ